jgi:hypothetical protein
VVDEMSANSHLKLDPSLDAEVEQAPSVTERSFEVGSGGVVCVSSCLAVPVEDNSVSLVELKALAARRLREGSELRSIILSEPDSLERREAIPMLKLFVKLLYLEYGLG